MLAVHCPDVLTPTGLVLLPLDRIVSMTSDAGRLTVVLACDSGHLHEVVDGRPVVSRPLVGRQVAAPLAVAC